MHCLFKVHLPGILLMPERLLYRPSSLPPQFSVQYSQNTSQSVKIILKIVPQFRRELLLEWMCPGGRNAREHR